MTYGDAQKEAESATPIIWSFDIWTNSSPNIVCN
jgi:hypothetical protein